MMKIALMYKWLAKGNRLCDYRYKVNDLRHKTLNRIGFRVCIFLINRHGKTYGQYKIKQLRESC